MKKILITGANSYIGTAVEKWFQTFDNYYDIDIVDMTDDSWRKNNFASYDAVYHVAGIAHADIGKVSDETKSFYYKINTDLAVETATKAKNEGVKQFVFMSSILVYGESANFGQVKMINKDTAPSPANFYGDSKWQAEQKIQKLEDKNFKVVIIRSPMIYGKGSKGNYPTLAKMAQKLLFFPNIQNQRSMIYIDNLCEFIRLVIENEESGIFFPQNEEYSRTSQLVQMIATSKGHNIVLTKLLNPFVWLAAYIPGKIGGLVNKAFGNLTYDKEISVYEKGDYQIVSLEESIIKTEK